MDHASTDTVEIVHLTNGIRRMGGISNELGTTIEWRVGQPMIDETIPGDHIVRHREFVTHARTYDEAFAQACRIATEHELWLLELRRQREATDA